MTAKSLFKRVKLDKNQCHMTRINNQQILVSISDDNVTIETIRSLIERIRNNTKKYAASALVTNED